MTPEFCSDAGYLHSLAASRRKVGFGAGGDDKHVGLLIADEVWIGLGIEAEIDTELRDFELEVAGHVADLGVIRLARGEKHLASELVRTLEQNDVVAAAGRRLGDLQPGEAATHDHDPLRRIGLRHGADGKGALIAGVGIVDAADRLVLVDLVDAGVVARDAVADLVDCAPRASCSASPDR